VTVLDVSGLDPEPMNAVVRTVATAIYEARLAERIDRLPWLLIDEAHAFFSGIAAPAIERILRRGRAPGVSLVAATQQPATISRAGITQSDLLLSHRLTAASDIEALRNVQPTYLEGSLTERLPENPGEVVVVDDTTESVHTVRIRRRVTPHGGTNPRVSERVTTDD
jgi:DNA helicase HerA-like ATPase